LLSCVCALVLARCSLRRLRQSEYACVPGETPDNWHAWSSWESNAAVCSRVAHPLVTTASARMTAKQAFAIVLQFGSRFAPKLWRSTPGRRRRALAAMSHRAHDCSYLSPKPIKTPTTLGTWLGRSLAGWRLRPYSGPFNRGTDLSNFRPKHS